MRRGHEDEYGLEPSNGHTSDDSRTREGGVAYLKRCVDATAAMGADQLSGVIYVEIGKRPLERPHEEIWRRSADALREVGEYAQQGHIRLGLEPVNRYESPLVNTCAQALALSDRIGLPTCWCISIRTI